MDSVALGSHYVSRAFLTGSGGRLFRGVWTRLPGVMRGVVEGGGARSVGKRTAPSLTMVSAGWRGTERGEAGPAVMTRSSHLRCVGGVARQGHLPRLRRRHLRVCWGSRLERNAIKKEYESSPGVLGESGAAGSAVRLARVVRTREPGGPGGGGGASTPPLLRPVPTSPRRSSRMVGRRLACRDAAGLLGPLKCGWTTCVPLDHLVHEIRWSNRI